MTTSVNYNNLMSKLILAENFKYQFAVPEPVPKTKEAFFKWYEKRVLKNVDLSAFKITKPVFIVALPRTGSTVLQDLLGKHQDTAYITNLMHAYPIGLCGAEALRRRFDLNVSGERFFKDSIMIDATSAADPVGTWGRWAGTDVFSVDYVELSLKNYSQEQIQRIYNDIRKVIWCFNSAEGSGNGNLYRERRFIMKMPGFVPHILLLQELFPDAKFIHLVRDARYCANSMVKLYNLCHDQLAYIRKSHNPNLGNGREFIPYPHLKKFPEYVEKFGPGDIRMTAHLWDDSIRFMNERRKDVRNICDVRYEDILARPEQEMNRIFDFCELKAVSKDNDGYWKMLAGVGKIGHKNNYGQFDTIEDICRETMRQYEYIK